MDLLAKDKQPTLMKAYGALGFQIVISVAGLGYLGYLADQKWDASPAFLITGLVLGTMAAFYQLIRIVRKVSSNDD